MKKQCGLTMISWLIVIVFLLFQIVIAMNVIPVYLNDSSVKNIMKELPNDLKARGATQKGLVRVITQKLSINNIYAIKADNIKIVKGRAKYIVTIEYEPRGKLVGNLDYIVSFKHEATIPTR